MPNWCNNILGAFTREGELVSMPAQYLNDKGGISLNKIHPRPAILEKVVTGGQTIDGEYVNRWATDEVVVDGETKFVDRKITKEEEDQINALGYESWYEWSLANWGTKWEVESDDMSGWQVFDSAWAPPTAAIRKLSALCPDLYFYLGFEEPGMNFSGFEIFHQGEIVYSADMPCAVVDEEGYEMSSAPAVDCEYATEQMEIYLDAIHT